MGSKRPYERRISSEEAREGYILVLKSRLGFFPAVGTPFEMTCGGRSRRVKVEARACTCRGPHKPHEHYFIRWPGLQKGERIKVRKGGAYVKDVSG